MSLTHMQIKELLDDGRKHNCNGYGRQDVCVNIAAIADLPSRFGDFHVVAFYNDKDDKEHAAFVHGDVCEAEDYPVRVHSECLTGDAIGSLRCDCRDQLEAALKTIGEMDAGIPSLCWKMKDGVDPGFSLYDLADRLRSRGWQVPAYSLPPNRQDLAIQRILVRHGVSRDLGSLLVDDMQRAIEYFEQHPVHTPMTNEEASGFSH